MALGTESPMRDKGPAIINWDPSGDNLDIYPTNGAINFKTELNVEDINEDGHGNAPVDSVDMGRIITIEADFTRLTLELLETVIHGSTAGVNNLKVPNKVGNAFYANAKQLIIKPLSDGNLISADTSEWIYVFKAYPVEAIELLYSKGDQRIFHVVFKVYPDDTSGNWGQLYRIGPA